MLVSSVAAPLTNYAASSLALPVPRTLVVEAGLGRRRWLEQIVRRRGHSLASCPEMGAAASALKDAAFDGLLLGVLPPGEDRADLCALACGPPAAARPVVLVVGGESCDAERARVLRLGAANYLPGRRGLAILEARLPLIEARAAERARAERAQAAGRLLDRLLAVVAGVPVILLALDLQERFVLAVGGGLERLGVVPGDVTGRTLNETVEQFPTVVACARRALGGQSGAVAVEGLGRTFAVRFEPLVDGSGAPAGAAGTAVDVTDTARADRHEALIRAVLQTLTDGTAPPAALPVPVPSSTPATPPADADPLPFDLPPLPTGERLSDRDRRLLALLVAGKKDAQIAQAACLAESTVGKYLGEVYGKLAVHSRSESVAWGLRHGRRREAAGRPAEPWVGDPIG